MAHTDDEQPELDETSSESDNETDASTTELDDTVADEAANETASETPGGDNAETDETASDNTDQGETFDRAYVEKLRRESAGYRERARTADHFAQRLHTELVRATGRLADPTDLAFDDGHLDDPEALTAAIDDLLTRKPHLATRRPAGDIGQGATASASTVDLAAILRQRAQ